MNKTITQLPPEQEEIRAKCIHPTGMFVEFTKEEVEQSIPERFEKIVQQYPNRLAVKMRDRSLTYDELNRIANRIARAILAIRGEGSEPIALLFEHGIDVIAAIFGALKAGKIFLSLDPSFPPERNAFMLGDAQAALIVTNSRNVDLADRLTGDARALLNIDGIEESVSADNLNLSQVPGDVATIRYTSGSTGEPKGVVKTHRNILHSVMLHADEMRTSIDDRLSLLHSVSFASAHVNLFQSLLNGASLVLFDVKSEGIQRLARWLREEQITVYHSPPALFRQLADSLSGKEKLSKLRLIHLSGAPITQLDFDLYKQNFCPGTLLEIGMGSTEAGEIGSAFVDETFSFPKEGSPVGYSRPDKRILLLDENGHEVGPGQVGEIAVKSRNLNPGYWRRPELTDSRFLHDPTGRDERVYLTGDFGRMLTDGFLIHLGRKDFMVKIRGYRVELAEIERALLAHPQVKDAGVAAWDQEPGEKHLVAYVVPREDAAPTINELHNFLKEKLPDYMMPSAFMFLESLPLTNGKLDRKAFPKPDHERPELNQPYVTPQSDVEQKLVQIWEEVLDLRPIGIRDDFFDLGGHSLLAARLFVHIEKTFGKNLSPATLFQAPTVEQLANIVRQEGWSAPWSLMVPTQPAGSKPPFFWAWEAAGDMRLERHLDPDQPLYWLMHQCHGGKRAVYTRLEDIAAQHLKEIRTVQLEGPYFLGGFCFGGMVAFEMAQQLQKQGEQVALLVLLDLATLKNCKPFHDQGPSYREPSPKIISYRDKVLRHFHNIALLEPKEKVTYVLVGVKDRIRAMIARGADIAKDIACNVCWTTGYPSSPSLQMYNLSKVDRRILRDYEPRMYSGPVILIKAKDSSWDPNLIGKLVAGDLEIHEVPGSHGQIKKEPYGQTWAQKLRSCLAEAQAKTMAQHNLKVISNTRTGITPIRQSGDDQLDNSRVKADEFQ